MKILATVIAISIAATTALALAQPPGRGGNVGPGRGNGSGRPGGLGRTTNSQAASTLDAFVAKWLTMDENSDGRVERSEMQDARLTHLFEATDKNHDDVVDSNEMKLLFESTVAKRRGPGPRDGAGATRRGGPPR